MKPWSFRRMPAACGVSASVFGMRPMADSRRYALDIPYIARENSTAQILALRKAWARAAG
jgi:hypothetical protein